MIGISRQRYYKNKYRAVAKMKQSRRVIDLVKAIRLELPRLGTRKLYYILRAKLNAIGVGRDKLFRILKSNHLLIRPKKSYHITTNSHHRFKKHKNKIEDLEITYPEQVFVSDITYLGSRSAPMYLSLVTDAYSKKIMGYDVSTSLHTIGSLNALKMAIKNRIYQQQEVIHHSDRGLQYCSDAYQGVLSKNKIICSMTEKYDPYQNAIAERVNGIIKQEFINDLIIKDIGLMKLLIKNSVELYNKKRPHSSCQLLTPHQMHLQRTIQRKTYKNQKQNTPILEYSV